RWPYLFERLFRDINMLSFRCSAYCKIVTTCNCRFFYKAFFSLESCWCCYPGSLIPFVCVHIVTCLLNRNQVKDCLFCRGELSGESLLLSPQLNHVFLQE